MVKVGLISKCTFITDICQNTTIEILSIHGWVKSTVIERRQQQSARMADFPPPVTFSVFHL